jgi:hypothetical protein
MISNKNYLSPYGMNGLKRFLLEFVGRYSLCSKQQFGFNQKTTRFAIKVIQIYFQQNYTSSLILTLYAWN